MSLPQEESVIRSSTTFQGQILNVRVDAVTLPGGQSACREIVEHGSSVCIVPLDHDFNVTLVTQFRLAPGRVLLEIPAGGIEKDESPEEAAWRELKEETGQSAGQLQHLASFWMSPGYCTEMMHAFLATDLTLGSSEQEEDENIRVELVHCDRVVQMIKDGQITDGKSIASIYLALDKLKTK